MATFDDMFKVFSASRWADEMRKVKEDSPYHREESVWIHTEMTREALYSKMASHFGLTPQEYLIVDTALLFHDVGKPPCLTVNFKEERGWFNSFYNHELRSARMFETFYVSNYALFKDWLSVEDAYKVMWLIENHLPYYAIETSRQANYLKTAVHHQFEGRDVVMWAHLMSDTYGRISDDAESKRNKTWEFCESMPCADLLQLPELKQDAPQLLILIGASGTGKSSFAAQKIAEGFAYCNWDMYRVKLALQKGIPPYTNEIDLYAAAYEYVDTHRSEFSRYAQVEFVKIMKDYHNVVVDNTCLTAKRRAEFVNQAKNRGYKVSAVLTPVSVPQLMSRMDSRDDKQVPRDKVLTQFYRLSLPWKGVEVHDVIYNPSNLEKTHKWNN